MKDNKDLATEGMKDQLKGAAKQAEGRVRAWKAVGRSEAVFQALNRRCQMARSLQRSHS